eukprot:COSAG01_NODE_3119_length_6560_cov_719.065315_2_plen_90_part_00
MFYGGNRHRLPLLKPSHTVPARTAVLLPTHGSVQHHAAQRTAPSTTHSCPSKRLHPRRAASDAQPLCTYCTKLWIVRRKWLRCARLLDC